MSVKDRVRVHETRLLSDNWYVLKTITFDWKRNGEAGAATGFRDLLYVPEEA